MECKDVGSTNADIAGLGIILSFVIQGGLSFILSFWSYKIELQTMSKDGIQLFSVNMNMVQDNIAALSSSSSPLVRNISGLIRRCLDLDNARGQRIINSRPISELHGSKLTKKLIDQVLAVIGDTQVLNGIALLIGALAQHDTLTLYHHRVIYDTASFTGVSACAASIVLFESKGGPLLYPLLLLAGYGILYFCFIIQFGLALRTWDDAEAGHCYSTHNIADSASLHPKTEMIYLGVTSVYWFATLSNAIIVALPNMANLLDDYSIESLAGRAQRHWDYTIKFMLPLFRLFVPKPAIKLNPKAVVIVAAMMQYPLHCYMLLALRNSNQLYLSGESENTWGFGQVVALVLLGSTILKCIQAFTEYHIEIRKRSMSQDGWRRRAVLGILEAILIERADYHDTQDPSPTRDVTTQTELGRVG